MPTGKTHKPTPKSRANVETLVSFGVPLPIVGQIVGCGRNTLAKYYRDEIDIGAAKANVKVAQALFVNATERNNVTAQIFWLKCRARWVEKADTPAPVATPDVSIDFSRLDDDELVILERLFRKAGSKDGKPWAMALAEMLH